MDTCEEECLPSPPSFSRSRDRAFPSFLWAGKRLKVLHIRGEPALEVFCFPPAGGALPPTSEPHVQRWLFREGEPGDRLYVVPRAGASPSEGPHVLRLLGLGAVLGRRAHRRRPLGPSVQAVRDLSS